MSREDAWWLGRSQVRFLVAERRFLMHLGQQLDDAFPEDPLN